MIRELTSLGGAFHKMVKDIAKDSNGLFQIMHLGRDGRIDHPGGAGGIILHHSILSELLANIQPEEIHTAGRNMGVVFWDNIYSEFSYEIDDGKPRDRLEIICLFMNVYGMGTPDIKDFNKKTWEADILLSNPLRADPGDNFIKGLFSGLMTAASGNQMSTTSEMLDNTKMKLVIKKA